MSDKYIVLFATFNNINLYYALCRIVIEYVIACCYCF